MKTRMLLNSKQSKTFDILTLTCFFLVPCPVSCLVVLAPRFPLFHILSIIKTVLSLLHNYGLNKIEALPAKLAW